MGKKRILGWIVISGAALAAALALVPLRPPADTPRAQPPERAQAGAAESRFASLPAREAIGKPRGELFGPLPAPVTARAPALTAAEAPPKPAAPPVPYRVAGQVVHDGAMQVVLAKGDRVLTAREGDMLEEGYRVESITPEGVTLLYPPLGQRAELPVAGLKLDLQAAPAVTAAALPPEASAASAESRPAQLRWVGPERVQAGSNFTVALKLTSEEPVLASPLQLSFDAKLLEAVAVRPGGFLADGTFTYRVNPAGSIFVGAASGAGGVAADAEFLIVTFKPIRSGAAELKLSSVVLQGAAGRAIVHEPPAAFRTAIVQ